MSSLGGLDGYESSSSSDSEGSNQDDIGKPKNDSDVNTQAQKYFKLSSTEKHSQSAQEATIPKPFEEKRTLSPKFTSSLKRVRVDESSHNIEKKRLNSKTQTNLLPPQLRGRPNVCTEDVEQFGVSKKKEKK